MNRKILIIGTGAIILCFAGFYNRFPVLTPDTDGYITSGFLKVVPFDRFILYGIFAVLASWGKSLWLVILTQAMILSVILYYFFHYFLIHKHSDLYYLGCVFFISFLMPVSISASTIDAGVFAGIAFLCGGLILFAGELRKRDLYIIALVLLVSLGMDLVNLITFFLIVVIYSLSILFKKRLLKPDDFKMGTKRILLCCLLSASACMGLSAINLIMGANFGLIRDFNVLMLPRIINSDLTEIYIDKNADKHDTAAFLLKDNLDSLISSNVRLIDPNIDTELHQTYQNTAHRIISQPGFTGKFLKESVKAFIFQSISFSLTKDINHKLSHKAVHSIFKWYREDMRAYYLSKQFHGSYLYRYINYCQLIFLIISLIISLFLIFIKSFSFNKKLFIYILITFLTFSLISALLHGKNEMLFHIAWLFIIPVIMVLPQTEKLTWIKGGKFQVNQEDVLINKGNE